MALYTIADLHLPLGIDKPMDIFGRAWENYVDRLRENWQSKIGKDDIVVIPGDFSWATYLQESVKDFEYLNSLNGKKILIKGNHDYWWTTKNKLHEFIIEHGFSDIDFLQNNFFAYKDIALCGTRGWIHPAWDNFGEEDRKIFNRETARLELSLNAASSYKEIYVFTHYPPMSLARESNEFIGMMKKYNVTKCIYGHLHGASHKNAINDIIDGIEYKLVSGDYIAFDPVKLAD
ncbi:MAG: metallophosphoesterase [Oscillospiraceae bacterium]|nr:metallophosphoesterase [Oscillospiraceae bacterium]